MSGLLFLIFLLVNTAWGLPPYSFNARASTPGSFSVEMHPNPRFKRNGPAEYARAHLKYGVPLPDSLAKFVQPVKTGGGKGDSENYCEMREMS